MQLTASNQQLSTARQGLLAVSTGRVYWACCQSGLERDIPQIAYGGVRVQEIATREQTIHSLQTTLEGQFIAQFFGKCANSVHEVDIPPTFCLVWLRSRVLAPMVACTDERRTRDEAAQLLVQHLQTHSMQARAVCICVVSPITAHRLCRSMFCGKFVNPIPLSSGHQENRAVE